MENHDKNMTLLMNRILEVRYENLELERDYCLLLEEAAKAEGYTYGLAFAYVYLVDCYLSHNDSFACLNYLREGQTLCEDNGFYELQLQLYDFGGLYYLRLGDEQAALMNYLEGLDLARAHSDYHVESSILSNIGLGFRNRGDYATAKYYFRSAYEVMSQHATEDNLYRCVIFLCYQAEVSQFLGQLADSRNCLELCYTIDTKVFYKHIRVYAGWCGHYAASGDAESSMKYADLVLQAHLERREDRFFAIEMFQAVCMFMLKLKIKDYSKQFIDLLQGLHQDNYLESSYKLQMFEIQYAELFLDKKAQISAYKEFYVITKKMEELSNKIYSDGMTSKILLVKALEERAQIQSQNVQLKDASYMDELTHLCNRRYFNKVVSKAFNRKDVRWLGFVMVDVDYFKQYNDYYGHYKGDLVLQTVARCLRIYDGEKVCAGRYGGDEFICLCVNMTNEEVDVFAEQVCAEISQANMKHSCSQCSDRVTLSIGCCNEETGFIKNMDYLLELADQALYEAKERGRNCYYRMDRMETEYHAR